VYEAATHRLVPLPSVPVGEINGVEISANEQSMALYVNGSRSPSNLYLLDLGTGKLRQLTQNLSPDVDPANLVEARVVRFPLTTPRDPLAGCTSPAMQPARPRLYIRPPGRPE